MSGSDPQGTPAARQRLHPLGVLGFDPDPGQAGTWVRRGSAVRQDPDVAHLVATIREYVAGPEPCEACRAVLVYFRRFGETTGPGEQYRITSTNHGCRPGDVFLHSQCGMGCRVHDRADCERARTEPFSATFVRDVLLPVTMAEAR